MDRRADFEHTVQHTMVKLYKQAKSKNWSARVQVWDAKNARMVTRRVSTGTDEETAAIDFAEALESAAKVNRALSGQTITRKHAESLFFSLLSQAGIAVEDSEPLPELREFIADYMAAKEGQVSAQTLKVYTTCRNRFLAWLSLEAPKDAKLDWLTRQRAAQYYSHLRETLAVKTSKECFKWLSRILKKAVQETSLRKNPCEGVELDLRGETLQRLPFTLEEAKQVIGCLLTQGEREREWARLAALSVMSGCRIEDALLMSVSNISKEGVLKYRQKKTGKDIACPLVVPDWLSLVRERTSGPIAPTLAKEFKDRGNARLSSEFTGFVSKAGVVQEFKTFKSGRKVARKTFHSLRHTLRTAIIASGGSDAQADVILGHSEGEGKRYTHAEVGAMRGTLEQAFTQS